MMFYLSLASIFALGYLAQTTGLCMVRGVKQTMLGKPMFLISILFSGTLAWISMGAAEWFGTQDGTHAYWPNAYSFIGGLLFGLGASVNGGCGVSTVSRFARGELVMFSTMSGWLFGWLLFLPMFPISDSKTELVLFGERQYLLLIPLTVVIFIKIYSMRPDYRKLWLSMLGIGLMAGVVFVTEPNWTPSGLLQSISFSLWYQNESSWPAWSRFVLVISMLMGMISAAFVTRSFDLRWFNLKVAIRHLFAGIFMGCGASIAGGGNDSQLLVAMPSLSLAGLATVASIVVGIFLGLKMFSRASI